MSEYPTPTAAFTARKDFAPVVKDGHCAACAWPIEGGFDKVHRECLVRACHHAEALQARADKAESALAASERAQARLRELVVKWRSEAEKDHHTATDDTSGGVWAYQHEASGRSRKGKQCADELEEALRTADAPPAPPKKENTVIDKHKAGLYRKYDVRRTDGSDGPGGKHHGCNYFVLDLTHDPHAIPALRAYAESCRADYPTLSDELMAIVESHPSISVKPATEPEVLSSKVTVWLVREGDSWPMLVDSMWLSEADANARAIARGGNWRAMRYPSIHAPATTEGAGD